MGKDLLNTLRGDTATADWRLKKIVMKFDDHFKPSTNETVERYCFFFCRYQGVSESIDSYVTELRLLTKMCNFRTSRDLLIQDRIVCGGSNAGMRK